jgi:hypothetical protein
MAIETVAVLAAAAAVEAARNRGIRKADEAWSAYAKSHAMTHEPARGWVRREWPRVEGTLGGVTVAIEVAAHLTQLGYSTALVALPKAPRRGNLELTREGLSSKVTKLFGAQDLVLGDDAFDRAFVVKATSEPFARELLTPNVRAELLALDVSRLACDDAGDDDASVAMVVAEIVGIVDQNDTLDRGLRLVAELASALGIAGS